MIAFNPAETFRQVRYVARTMKSWMSRMAPTPWCRSMSIILSRNSVAAYRRAYDGSWHKADTQIAA
jgi:hypothetical protein